MESRRTVTEVARNFPEYIDRVVRGGERFVLVKDEQPVAELSPIPPTLHLRDLPDVLASLPHLSPEELDAFEADVAEARKESLRSPIRDPWDS